MIRIGQKFRFVIDEDELTIASDRYPHEYEEIGIKNNIYIPNEIRTNIRQRKLTDIMEEDIMLEQSSTKTASLSFL